MTATLSPDLAHAAGIDPRREQLVLTLLLATVVAVPSATIGMQRRTLGSLRAGRRKEGTEPLCVKCVRGFLRGEVTRGVVKLLSLEKTVRSSQVKSSQVRSSKGIITCVITVGLRRILVLGEGVVVAAAL